MADNKRKRHKKQKNAEENSAFTQEPEKTDQTTEDQKTKLYSDVNTYLGLDFSKMSSANQLKYKFYTDILLSSLSEKSNQNLASNFFKLYSEANEKEISIESLLIKNKNQIISLESDLEKAKEIYDKNLKKLQDKDKFQKLIIDKAEKISEEKQKFYEEEKARKSKIIEEAENYVKDLAQKQIEEEPEREKLIQINNLYRGEIQKCLLEGLQLKDDFEKQLKESEEKLKMFDISGKKSLQETMSSFSLGGEGLFETTSLRTELQTYEEKLKEMENLKKMVVEQERKLLEEMNNKKNEAILIASENDEINSRIKKGIKNSEELKDLRKTLDSGKNKLKIMQNLNKKYTEQFEKLTEELNPKKVEEEHPCCGHEHHHHEEEHDECGCGHEHAHEEEKEHDECGCGHEHPHEEEKEHDECGCGHEHPHENEEHEHDKCMCGCEEHEEKKIETNGFQISSNTIQFESHPNEEKKQN